MSGCESLPLPLRSPQEDVEGSVEDVSQLPVTQVADEEECRRSVNPPEEPVNRAQLGAAEAVEQQRHRHNLLGTRVRGRAAGAAR